jgi:ABC-type transporter Mla subunit MlaD
MGEENVELRHKNEYKRKEANAIIVEKEKTLEGLKATNNKLTEKNNQLKHELADEVNRAEEYYQRELGRFYQNTKNKLKNFGKKALNESSVLANKMNKKMDGLLENVNSNMGEFNSKVAVESNEKFNINVDDTILKLNETRKGK